jgi:hypothetical protein
MTHQRGIRRGAAADVQQPHHAVVTAADHQQASDGRARLATGERGHARHAPHTRGIHTYLHTLTHTSSHTHAQTYTHLCTALSVARPCRVVVKPAMVAQQGKLLWLQPGAARANKPACVKRLHWRTGRPAQSRRWAR